MAYILPGIAFLYCNYQKNKNQKKTLIHTQNPPPKKQQHNNKTTNKLTNRQKHPQLFPYRNQQKIPCPTINRIRFLYTIVSGINLK